MRTFWTALLTTSWSPESFVPRHRREYPEQNRKFVVPHADRMSGTCANTCHSNMKNPLSELESRGPAERSPTRFELLLGRCGRRNIRIRVAGIGWIAGVRRVRIGPTRAVVVHLTVVPVHAVRRPRGRTSAFRGFRLALGFGLTAVMLLFRRGRSVGVGRILVGTAAATAARLRENGRQ